MRYFFDKYIVLKKTDDTIVSVCQNDFPYRIVETQDDSHTYAYESFALMRAEES